MRNKILISSFIMVLMCIFTLFISNNVYANDYLEKWTYDEMMATKTKYEYGTYTAIDQFYATPNMDSVRVIKKYYKELVWNGIGPWFEEEEEIYMGFGEYPADPDILVLQPHYGFGKTVYSRLTRPKIIDSYDGKAEYIIGINQYDQVLLIIDGSTYSGDLGAIVNDFFKNKVEEQYRKEHEFLCDYSNAAKEGGCITISRYREGEEIYMAACCYQVGFNLTKEAPQTPVDNSLEDPAIYGGNDDVQIDDTPTQKPEVNEYDPWKVVVIVVSSRISVVGIYLIYLLGKKIYEIMKGK
jgi:hypothetical protein